MDRQITNDKHFRFKLKQKFLMKRDALTRKKSQQPQSETTLSKHPNRKERKRAHKFKRKSTHHLSNVLYSQNQSTQPNNTEKLQKMEPQTAQNSQQIEPQSQIQPYIPHIIAYLSQLDHKFYVKNSKTQSAFPHAEVNLHMRKTLIKWLYKFATILKLKSETLHICIQLIDCMLIHNPSKITKGNFQLLGVTALFMSCKLSQVINPEPKRFTDACDGLYTLPDLFKMEEEVLLMMNFELQVPTIHQFLDIFIEEESFEREQQYLLKSLAELCTYDFNLFNGYDKKTINAVVIYLWSKVSGVQEIRSKKLMQKYDISCEIFEKCLRELMGIYRKSYLFTQSASNTTFN